MNTSNVKQFGNLKFAIKAHVTRSLLQLVEGKPVFVKVDGLIYQAENNDATKAAEAAEAAAAGLPVTDKKAPYILPVTNLETGEVQQMIANSVLHKELDKAYPEGVYVGKTFMFTRQALKKGRGGNNYATFEIAEIEVESDEPEANEPAAPAPKIKK